MAYSLYDDERQAFLDMINARPGGVIPFNQASAGSHTHVMQNSLQVMGLSQQGIDRMKVLTKPMPVTKNTIYKELQQNCDSWLEDIK